MNDNMKFRAAMIALVIALLIGALYGLWTFTKVSDAGLKRANDPAAAAARAMTFTEPKAPHP